MTYPITSSTIAAKKHLPRGRYLFRSWCRKLSAPVDGEQWKSKETSWPRMATDGDLEGDMKPQPCWLFRSPADWLTGSLIHSLHSCCVDAWQVSISILIIVVSFPHRNNWHPIPQLSLQTWDGYPSATVNDLSRWSVTVAASGLAGTQARRDLHQNSCATWEGFREWLGGGALRISRMF